MKQIVETDKAPSAIGPYSQAVKWNGMVFVSGQIALNPESGEVSGDIQAQTRTVLSNLGAILEAAGSGLDKALKITVYLADMNDFSLMNEVYASFFKDDPPARAAVEVSALPKGAAVEMDAIAALG